EASLRESVQPGNDSGAAKVHPAIPARLIIIALDILRMCRPPIVEHFFGVSDDRSDRASHTLRIPTLTGNTFVAPAAKRAPPESTTAQGSFRNTGPGFSRREVCGRVTLAAR